MAKTRKPARAPSATTITRQRAGRLYRLLALLGEKPQTRAGVTRRLRQNLRGFYRDLEVLRRFGIEVELANGRYALTGAAGDAQGRLPFPDPGLSLGEALQLAKGRTAAHRKLRDQIAEITG